MTHTVTAPHLGLAGSPRFVSAIGALLVAGGGALAAIRFFGGTPAERGLEGALGAAALGAVVAVPGVLAFVALHDRPALLLPAAVILVPLSFLSFALVTLPLLVPAAMLSIAYGRRSPPNPNHGVRAVTTTAVVTGLLVAAVVALFVREDARSYSTAHESGSVSDVITWAEAMLSFALSAAAVAAGWLLAPGRRGHSGGGRSQRTTSSSSPLSTS